MLAVYHRRMKKSSGGDKRGASGGKGKSGAAGGSGASSRGGGAKRPPWMPELPPAAAKHGPRPGGSHPAAMVHIADPTTRCNLGSYIARSRGGSLPASTRRRSLRQRRAEPRSAPGPVPRNGHGSIRSAARCCRTTASREPSGTSETPKIWVPAYLAD